MGTFYREFTNSKVMEAMMEPHKTQGVPTQGVPTIDSNKSTSHDNKRCYFKSNYCQSHPFLTTDHKITTQDEIKEVEPRRKTTEGENSSVFH